MWNGPGGDSRVGLLPLPISIAKLSSAGGRNDAKRLVHRDTKVPIPALTPYGVLPAGQHDCTYDEVADVYASNPHRQALWDDFTRFRGWLVGQPNPAFVLLDGGFTSDKAAPKDIDIVFDLTGCDAGVQGHWFRVFFVERAHLQATFRVDFWVYAPGSTNDLRAFFGYVKPEEAILRGMQPGDLKGLLRIAP